MRASDSPRFIGHGDMHPRECTVTHEEAPPGRKVGALRMRKGNGEQAGGIVRVGLQCKCPTRTSEWSGKSGRRRGELANLRDLNFSVSGSFSQAGWADVLVTDAVDSKTPETHLTARNKRARSVRSALMSLDEAGLLEVPRGKKGAPIYDQFVLLNECGYDAIGEFVPYKKPAKQEPTFFAPAGLIDNGWVHVLEDMELALLLMICCREGGFIKNGFTIPAETRLLNYGIHRDAFSAARKTLEWLGLIEVIEMDRNADGTAQEKNLSLHRLEIVKSGFGRPALPTALQTFERQIERSHLLS